MQKSVFVTRILMDLDAGYLQTSHTGEIKLPRGLWHCRAFRLAWTPSHFHPYSRPPQRIFLMTPFFLSCGSGGLSKCRSLVFHFLTFFCRVHCAAGQGLAVPLALPGNNIIGSHPFSSYFGIVQIYWWPGCLVLISLV